MLNQPPLTMRPVFPSNDPCNGIAADAVINCQPLLAKSEREQLADVSNARFVQLSIRVRLARQRSAPSVATPTLYFFPHIFCVTTVFQMKRSYTRRVVAFMENQRFRPSSIINVEGDPVGQISLFFTVNPVGNKGAVAFLGRSSSPCPALTERSLTRSFINKPVKSMNVVDREMGRRCYIVDAHVDLSDRLVCSLDPSTVCAVGGSY